MARFRKEVATEGNPWVTDPDTGERVQVNLNSARFLKWINSFNKLRAKGYNVPAPFGHKGEDGSLASPVRFGRNGVPDPLKNAGFIENLGLEYVPRQDGSTVATLVAEIDVPGDENDPNSPAYKVGKQVKDTSVYVRPNFLDGTGETHEEGFMHVALCLHPIEGGQKNFEPIKESTKGDFAIAMSQMTMSLGTQQPGALADQFENQPDDDDLENGGTSTVASGDIVQQVIKALRDAKIMDLPDDTKAETILQYINVACRQKAFATASGSAWTPPGQSMGGNAFGSQPGVPTTDVGNGGQLPSGSQAQQPTPAVADNADPQQTPATGTGNKPSPPSNPVNLKKPPKDAVEQPPSIAMSQTPNQANPDVAVLMSQVNTLQASNQLMTNYVFTLEADKRQQRINALIASGRVTKAYADEHLTPKLTGFTMSLDAAGKPVPHAIDAILAACEALPSKTGSVIAAANSISGIDMSMLPAGSQAALAGVLMSMGADSIPAGLTEQQLPGGASFFAAPGTEQVSEADGKSIAENMLKNTR